MIKQIYKRQDLPLGDLQRIGLAAGDQIMLDEDDLKALLAGRRTDMLRLENLSADGVHIPALDAKLSVKPNDAGILELMVHPIYREPETPSFLTDTQAEMLEKGEVPNLPKTIFDGGGHQKEVLVEFDKDTNEFIITDTEKIQAPDMVNGRPLTAEQKERYRKGKEVETEDGTTLQYAATEKQGIRSDKLALIASILIDGGVSFVLYKGLNALFNKKQDKAPGKNFDRALQDMSTAQSAEKSTVLAAGGDFEEDYSQGISR
jgi:hypothetical protein